MLAINAAGNFSQPERKIVSQKSSRHDELDAFLESKHLCRKRIPRDGNSLFRCLADQLMGSQTLHPIVRKVIFAYFCENQSEVEKVVPRVSFCDLSFIDFMFQKVLTAICHVFKVHISVYREPSLEQQTYYYEGPESENCETITMSVDVEMRWDSIYPAEVMENVAFCQSIAYEMLYEDVFGLSNVRYSRAKMLDKSSKKMSMNHFRDLKGVDMLKSGLTDFSKYDEEADLKVLIDQGIPPFPYKVAKSLDPNIYRNIEYDVWDNQKESVMNGGGPKVVLHVGCKCIVHLKENIKCYGYVQQIKTEEEVALVFVEQLGEIRELPLNILEAVNSTGNRVTKKRSASESQWRQRTFSAKMNMNNTNGALVDSMSENDHSNGGDNPMYEAQQSSSSDMYSHQSLYPGHPSVGSFLSANEHDAEVSEYAEYQDSDDYGYEANETISDSMNPTEMTTQQPVAAAAANSVNYVLPYVTYLQPINLGVDYSYAIDGSDLPFNDITTLRYFYNYGVQHVLAMRYGMYVPPSVAPSVPLDHGYSDGSVFSMSTVTPVRMVTTPQPDAETEQAAAYYLDQSEALSASQPTAEPAARQFYMTPEPHPTYVTDVAENIAGGTAQQLATTDYQHQFRHIPQAYYLPTAMIPQYVQANCPPAPAGY